MSDKVAIPKEVEEGFDLLNYFYGFSKENDDDRYLMKDTFRQDVYRLIVLQFHMAIELILKDFIVQALPKRKVFTVRQNKEYVKMLRSRTAINEAARLGIINKDCKEKLIALNDIRNECAHNWMLHSFVMKKYKKLKKRRYSVEFNGKNLLNPDVMKDEFMPIYQEIYLEFFGVSLGVKMRRHYLTKQVEAIHKI